MFASLSKTNVCVAMAYAKNEPHQHRLLLINLRSYVLLQMQFWLSYLALIFDSECVSMGDVLQPACNFDKKYA